VPEDSAGKEAKKSKKGKFGAELHPLFLLYVLLSCLLTSLSAPQGWLRARLPFFAEIFFLCAAVSPRTSTNTHLEAIPTQQVTTTQTREAGVIKEVGPYLSWSVTRSHPLTTTLVLSRV
jgi:hypothetical protein